MKFLATDVRKRVVIQGYDGIKGTIRFIGVHAEDGTDRIGVELDNPVGKNNGTVKVSRSTITDAHMLVKSALPPSFRRFPCPSIASL